MAKRLLDLALSLAALVLVSPVYLAIAILIRLGSRSPALFRQTRIGLHGRPFTIYKFRTMVVDAHKLGGPSTAGGDPRVTRVGRWLRRFNLDELPQLINVVKGDMSIVGPRPEVPQYVDLFTKEEREILTVRPGLTDWATLWIGDESDRLVGREDPEKAYLEEIWPEKHRLALEYVRHRSLLTDVKIIAQTMRVGIIDRFRTRPAGDTGERGCAR